MVSASTVFQIVQTIIMMLIGLSSFLIKRELARLDEKDKENKSSIDQFKVELDSLTDNLNDFKEDVSKEYVRYRIYVQSNAEINKKLDKIYDMLYELRGNVKGG